MGCKALLLLLVVVSVAIMLSRAQGDGSYSSYRFSQFSKAKPSSTQQSAKPVTNKAASVTPASRVSQAEPINIVLPKKNRQEYCSLSCKVGSENITHTVCRYDFKPKCNVVKYGLSDKLKESVRAIHNKLRHRIRDGKETRGSPGPQFAATSMPDLKWDNETADIAQHWANQCNYDHDKCRKTEREDLGQNIAKYTYKNPYGINVEKTLKNFTRNIEDLTQAWYNEVEYWNNADTEDVYSPPYPLEKQDHEKYQVGHFAQFVWAKTTRLGCGAIAFTNSANRPTELTVFLVCNYGERGNIIGRRIYVPKGQKKLIKTSESEYNLPEQAEDVDVFVKDNKAVVTYRLGDEIHSSWQSLSGVNLEKAEFTEKADKLYLVIYYSEE